MALRSNTIGTGNTATGGDALNNNTTGNDNTATGRDALLDNTTGNSNTATGVKALAENTIGSGNTATGVRALLFNTIGVNNTATGLAALFNNTIGTGNTAIGINALLRNTTGQGNIGLGAGAGLLLTTGNNNIDIGNIGVAGESNTIRLGKNGLQTATFIAGISGVAVTGAAVEVTRAGQLGVVASSARYKHDIRDLGGASSKLRKLRPVSFRYNNDPADKVQYGLVAEEEAKIYPELVTYGADGKVLTVRYWMLSAMLLNELQKQTTESERQAQQIKRLTAELEISKQRDLARRVALEERLAKLEHTIDAYNGKRKLAAALGR